MLCMLCSTCACVPTCTKRFRAHPPPRRPLTAGAGQPYGGALTVVGVLLGGAFIRSVQQRLAAYEDIEFGALQGSAGASLWLVGLGDLWAEGHAGVGRCGWMCMTAGCCMRLGGASTMRDWVWGTCGLRGTQG